MTIQLEEGKYYRTRDGRKVGPLRFTRVDGAKDKRWATAPGFSGAHWYTQYNDALWAGDYANASAFNPTVDDLMEEWVDEPEATHDPVEHPKHYTGHPPEPTSGIQLVTASVDGRYLRLNVVVDGKMQVFAVKPHVAASAIGRISEALARMALDTAD